MRKIRSESGFFLLVVVVSLIILAALLIPSMVALTGTSTFVVSINQAGNLAFAAAESGLKYGVNQLENIYVTNPPTQPNQSSPLAITSPSIQDLTPPCSISVNIELPACTAGQPLVYTVNSTAVCKMDSFIKSTRKLSVQVNATHAGHGSPQQCKGKYSFNTLINSWSQS